MALTGCSNSPSLPISVSLTPASAQALDQGAGLSVGINAVLMNDTSGKGVTWTLNGPGTLPNGPAYATYFPPTSALGSAQKVTVTATSIADPTKSASVQITVNPFPVIPYQALPAGTAGVPYNQTITLLGGTAPFQWSVYNAGGFSATSIGGSVPAGLTLNAATGTITGTPTAAGTYYFEAAAIDADGAAAFDGLLSIQINPAASSTGNAVPFLNQPLVPSAVSPGSGGLTLKVSGTGFVSGATVDFNDTPLATTFINSSHLSALVPATNVATAQTASITVVNPAPAGGASNVAFFQVGTPATTVNFANAPNSPLQVPVPAGLAIADFNQDGKPDLAIAGTVRLYTMLSNGNGTFTPAAGSPLLAPSPPYNSLGTAYLGPVAVGDFNHSGHSGLAVGEFQSEAAWILMGKGDGTLFPSRATFANAPGDPLLAIGVADFNADGNLDLAVINALSGISQVDLGYGAGAFNAAGQIPSGASVAVGDFNGDGKLDLVVAGSTVVSLGNGDGTFTSMNVPALSVGYGPSAIVAGDFNGDGKLDLATADASGNTIRVLLGNGDGTFQSPIGTTDTGGPEAMVLGDFNDDGKLDLAIANNGAGTVTLLLGNGDGTFTAASGSPYTVGKGPSAIVAADFNGDGKLDLAVANGLDGTGTVSILLQQ